MNAFISYSLLDIEDYIVTNLAGELAEQGFYSTTGSYRLTELSALCRKIYGIVNSRREYMFIGK